MANAIVWCRCKIHQRSNVFMREKHIDNIFTPPAQVVTFMFYINLRKLKTRTKQNPTENRPSYGIKIFWLKNKNRRINVVLENIKILLYQYKRFRKNILNL